MQGFRGTCFCRKGLRSRWGNNQIDLLTSVGSFIQTEKVFENAVHGKLEQFDVLYISKADLITAKRAAGRTKDLADVEELF